MIWPFKKADPDKYKVPELKEIRVGKKRFEPQADITAQEAALLIPVFAAYYGLSREWWIKEHNLERHFVEVNE
jgi:hypothetical protein